LIAERLERTGGSWITETKRPRSAAQALGTLPKKTPIKTAIKNNLIFIGLACLKNGSSEIHDGTSLDLNYLKDRFNGPGCPYAWKNNPCSKPDVRRSA
jgi:hypothetical protein